MKANELRIGNFVTIDNKNGWPQMKGVPVIVTGVRQFIDEDFPKSTGDVHLEGEGINDYFSQFDEFIQPIPLTEEYLLKFGFTKSDNGLVFDHPAPAVPENEYKDLGTLYPAFFFNNRPEVAKWMDCHTRVAIEYVHQLQNLYFALTGEELTIK